MRIEKNNLALLGIMLSVLSLSVIAVNPLKEAFALQQITVTVPHQVYQTKFIPKGTNGYVATFSSTDTHVYVYNATNNALVGNINFAGAIRSGSMTGYSLDNVSCDKSGNTGVCAISLGTSATSSEILLVNVYTLTSSNNSTRQLFASTLFPVVATTNDGTLLHFYTWYDDGVSTTINQLAINASQSLTLTSNRLVVQNTVNSAVRFTAVNTADSLQLTTGANSGNWILFGQAGAVQLWKVSTMSRACGLNLDSAGSTSDIQAINNYKGQGFYVTNDLGKFYQVDLSCTKVQDIDMSGNTANIRSMSYATDRKEIYLMGSNKIFVINQTSLSATPLVTFQTFNTPNYHFNNLVSGSGLSVNFNSSNQFIGFGGATSLYFIYWGTQGGSSGGSGGGGTSNTCNSNNNPPHCYGDVNCDISPNQNILGCQIVLQGNPPLASASQSTASSINFLLGQTGLVNSTNTNIKTNGTGYILTGVVMGIMVAVFYLASGGELRSMPTFIWFLGTLGVLGLAVAFGWLDTTFFIIAILAVIALASTRVIQQLELGGFK